MQYTVLTASKSPGISSGLTYTTKESLHPGTVVTVPLRKKEVEGIILEESKNLPSKKIALKEITTILHHSPLLSEAQIKTLKWIADYYLCTERQALSLFLSGRTWKHLLPTDTTTKGSEPTTTPPSLTEDQKNAWREIEGSKKPSLLFGVTSSGKTEIYAQLIADTVSSGKQAILLLPEILLTEHHIKRFASLLGEDQIAVMHSKLTPAKRRQEWKRIRFSNVPLIIGSRSALFSPVTNLGLIIIDEEHEWTYKNEKTPRYHARDVAEKLCEYSGAKLVLGTATPTLESWQKAKEGTYTLVTLKERYGQQALPTVKVIDLTSAHCGSHYPFSNTLLEAIDKRLQTNEQSVLFLNRRGMATSLLCFECRRRIVSPTSNLPFTVHKKNGVSYLRDHTTNETAALPDACPHCGSDTLKAVGAGTQGVEERLQTLFPHARILRADSDTLKTPHAIQELLSAMNNGDADILLGTQSVVKGLDLPKVTLAAVLIADVGLSLPHFRAGERVFQMLTQLIGRSGRHAPGEVIIQTFRPDAPEIKMASLHQTEDYLALESSIREQSAYPPFNSLLRLITRGEDAEQSILSFVEELKKNATGHTITASPTLFGAGREWHAFIRGKHPERLLEGRERGDIVVDRDPLDCV